MAELTAFLRRVAREPFVWGRSDCILTGADWVREVEGWDPAEDFRGQYDTEDEALAWLALSGGLTNMIDGHLKRPHIAGPRQGDVGVVSVRGTQGKAEVTAICTGQRWAAKSPGGLWIGRAECIAAWRIG